MRAVDQNGRDAAVPPAEIERIAAQKCQCPACGAEAHWNPGKRALICPFCGTESPVTLQVRGLDTLVVEHDLVAALRAVPDDARGWRAEKMSVRCQSCHAISVFDAGKVGQRCDFCGSSSLVPYEQVKDAFRPESLLPLAISEVQARELIRMWYGRQWLAPNRFRTKALTDTVRGVYLPYWTFDAAADAHWTADSGTYYYVKQGNRNVRHVRWTPVSGDLVHRFDDELVPASLGVDASRLRRIEPFPTGTLVPYDAGYLAGWTVERYQIDLVAAASRSRAQMDAKLRALCGEQVPGDTYRNLSVQTTYTTQTFKHILAPVWLMSYMHGRTSYQVVVNGVTGSLAGTRPWSWTKIALLVVLAVVIFVLIAMVDR